MPILNIAGYKFLALESLALLRDSLLTQCRALEIKGTILIGKEGININLAGEVEKIRSFQQFLKNDVRFTSISFHETYSDNLPFQKLKVKIKKEIITFHQPEVNPAAKLAPYITPQEFKAWLDENRDITILDTRNDFEIAYGTFKNAVNLGMNNFSEFPQVATKLNPEKTIVMFCTGGIRCEKAAVYLQNQGFQHVFQLQGGILGYFNQVGQTHFDGTCFVFDDRGTVSAS